MCTVMRRTPSVPSSRIGASGRGRAVGGLAQLVDEAAERQAAFRFVAPGQLGDLQHVGQHLLAAAPQHEAGVRARGLDETADGVGHGPVVAQAVQLAQRARAPRATAVSASGTGSGT